MTERLIGGIHWNDPWVTIARGDPYKGEFIYFQVFGSLDRMVIEGGRVTRRSPEWTWRLSALPVDPTSTMVGPSWYETPARESQVLTIHDALMVLWPALEAVDEWFDGIPGFTVEWWQP